MGNFLSYNMVRATFAALESQESPRQVAAKRGKKVSDIVSRRGGKVKAVEPVEPKETSKKEKAAPADAS